MCLRSVDTEIKLKYLLGSGAPLQFFSEGGDLLSGRLETPIELRMRRLAVVFYFAADIEAYVDELQQVLSLLG